MHRLLLVVGVSASVLACCALAGTAQAEPTSLSGTVPNGGCDAVRTVTVSAPSRIEITVSSTDAAAKTYGEVVAPDGTTAAVDSFDTPAAGTYGVRVCSLADAIGPPALQYTALYATGPAGQAALPRQQAQVLAATKTVKKPAAAHKKAVRKHRKAHR